MNDDRYIRSANIHPISKWLLRTVLDNLYAEDNDQLKVNIGESVETLDKSEYKQLQQDLMALGYSKEEVYRGMYDENLISDNMCRCFKA
ncbi:MAG: hypothetical protein IJV19_04110 [Prevotella sp.]|nr:hypothetical protein [Prevotella sp.]